MSDDVYRSCASIVVLKKEGDDIHVLLLHKPRKKDSWQLPQGGVEEGESIEQAAIRELKEEAGVNAKVIGKSERVYQYDFPTSYRKFRPDNVCGQRLEFVLGIIDEDQEIIVDRDEIDSFVWTNAEGLSKYLKRKEYCKFVQGLVEEGVKLLGSHS